jgi:hypothetical protein
MKRVLVALLVSAVLPDISLTTESAPDSAPAWSPDGVTGLWNNGTTATCTTNADGQCAVIRSGIPRKTTSLGFSVTNVTRTAFVYNAAGNHDPDGSSTGSAIVVIKP